MKYFAAFLRFYLYACSFFDNCKVARNCCKSKIYHYAMPLRVNNRIRFFLLFLDFFFLFIILLESFIQEIHNRFCLNRNHQKIVISHKTYESIYQITIIELVKIHENMPLSNNLTKVKKFNIFQEYYCFTTNLNKFSLISILTSPNQ